MNEPRVVIFDDGTYGVKHPTMERFLDLRSLSLMSSIFGTTGLFWWGEGDSFVSTVRTRSKLSAKRKLKKYIKLKRIDSLKYKEIEGDK